MPPGVCGVPVVLRLDARPGRGGSPRRRSVVISFVLLGLLATATPAAAVAGFGDVEAGRFYTEPVQWMVDEAMTTGTSPTCFSPDDPVTRGQAAPFSVPDEYEIVTKVSFAPTADFRNAGLVVVGEGDNALWAIRAMCEGARPDSVDDGVYLDDSVGGEPLETLECGCRQGPATCGCGSGG